MQRPPNIQTERLVLVALLPEDIEALWAYVVSAESVYGH